MKKFKYGIAYQKWEEEERNSKGFAFLIVRPEYRWKEVEAAVYDMIKKREATVVKSVRRDCIIQLSPRCGSSSCPMRSSYGFT